MRGPLGFLDTKDIERTRPFFAQPNAHDLAREKELLSAEQAYVAQLEPVLNEVVRIHLPRPQPPTMASTSVRAQSTRLAEAHYQFERSREHLMEALADLQNAVEAHEAHFGAMQRAIRHRY